MTGSPKPLAQPRLSDRQALTILGAYFGTRLVTARVAIVFLPWLLAHAVWAVPLLRNLTLTVITAAATAYDKPALLAAMAAGSLTISTIAGLMLYWAGSRFGPQLAERAAKQGTAWASVWNPKQVGRAHRFLERWGMLAIGFSRATGWLLTPIVLVAGSSRMRFRKFIAAHTAGAIVFAGVAMWLGVRAGTAWPWLPDKIKRLSDVSWKVGLVVLVLFAAAVALGGSKRESGDRRSGDTAS